MSKGVKICEKTCRYNGDSTLTLNYADTYILSAYNVLRMYVSCTLQKPRVRISQPLLSTNLNVANLYTYAWMAP